MNRLKREMKRRAMKKRKNKSFALYGTYTRDKDIANCKCKRHSKGETK